MALHRIGGENYHAWQKNCSWSIYTNLKRPWMYQNMHCHLNLNLPRKNIIQIYNCVESCSNLCTCEYAIRGASTISSKLILACTWMASRWTVRRWPRQPDRHVRDKAPATVVAEAPAGTLGWSDTMSSVSANASAHLIAALPPALPEAPWLFNP